MANLQSVATKQPTHHSKDERSTKQGSHQTKPSQITSIREPLLRTPDIDSEVNFISDFSLYSFVFIYYNIMIRFTITTKAWAYHFALNHNYNSYVTQSNQMNNSSDELYSADFHHLTGAT